MSICEWNFLNVFVVAIVICFDRAAYKPEKNLHLRSSVRRQFFKLYMTDSRNQSYSHSSAEGL